MSLLETMYQNPGQSKLAQVIKTATDDAAKYAPFSAVGIYKNHKRIGSAVKNLVGAFVPDFGGKDKSHLRKALEPERPIYPGEGKPVPPEVAKPINNVLRKFRTMRENARKKSQEFIDKQRQKQQQEVQGHNIKSIFDKGKALLDSQQAPAKKQR